jgi:hypothetical protein
LLEVILIPIPFIFYRYGGRIRMKSALIWSMCEDQERNQRKRERAGRKGLAAAVEKEEGEKREKGEKREEDV